MPRYELKCGCKTFEVNVSHDDMLDLVGQRCQKCQTFVKRVFTAPGVIFRGQGWAGKERK